MKPVAFFLSAFLSCACASCQAAEGWAIDAPMRFQIAYVPDGPAPLDMPQRVASLGLFPDFSPDIDNISLAGIKGLGFTLPERGHPEDFKLYLKLFEFPDCVDSVRLCDALFDAYHLSDMPGGEEITRYAADRAHLAVKYGLVESADRTFTPERPFPAFEASAGGAFFGHFAGHAPFFSLYLTPGTPPGAGSEDDPARDSVAGVTAFHKALLAHYSKVLRRIDGPEPDKYLSFRDDARQETIKVPLKPFVFGNWRDLPMPTNPQKHFLTGLLLVFRHQDCESPLSSDTVLEIGSIVRLQ